MRVFLLLLCCSCSRPSECRIPPDLIERVSAARGLTLSRPVTCRVERRSQVLRSLKEEMVKSISPERYKYEGEVFRLLGIIPPSFKYPDRVAELYAKGMRARYVADEKSVVLTRMSAGPGHDDTVLHELVHALQDQYLPLKTVLTRELSNDESLARAALLEGDAIVSSSAAGATKFCRSLNREAITRELALRSGSAAETASAEFSKLQLIIDFPYIFGPAYRCERQNDGGVADVLDLLPKSSAEVMQSVGFYPSITQEPESNSPIGTKEPNELFSDTLGQFTLLVFLTADLPFAEAMNAAEAWQNDRIALQPSGLTWRIWCRSEAKAQELAGALKQMPVSNLGRLSRAAVRTVLHEGRNVVLKISL